MKLTRLLAVSGFLWMATGVLVAQEKAAPSAPAPCDNCVNIAPCGDMSCITTSGQGSLNTFGLPWKSSHGSPSYSPGSLWIWSYNNNGEGVYYDGVTFLAGHTYCITFDTKTKTHDGSAPNPAAGFNVIATNSMTPSEIGGCCAPIPPNPSPLQMVGSEVWSTLPNPGSTTFTYTFTATSTWSQLWFHPYSSTLPQVELTLQNLRICDITAPPNPCDFQVSFDYGWEECYTYFFPNVFLSPGLTAIAYHWDFGDGSSSDEMSPSHFYTMSGGYTVTLTVLVINSDGDCCSHSFTMDIQAEACDPCEFVYSNKGYVSDKCNLTYYFSATGPDAPGFAYIWDFGDGTTGTGHDVSHTYGGPGPYVVSVTAYYYNEEAGICCHETYYFEVDVNPDAAASTKSLGHTRPKVEAPAKKVFEDMPEYLKERPIIDAGTSSGVEVFPNPNSGSFTVSSLDGTEIDAVMIYDLSGRLLLTVKGSSNTVDINMGAEQTGTYEVKVQLKDGSVSTQRLIRK